MWSQTMAGQESVIVGVYLQRIRQLSNDSVLAGHHVIIYRGQNKTCRSKNHTVHVWRLGPEMS